MWAGVVYGTLLERQGTHILLSSRSRIVLDDGVQGDFPVGSYLKVTYTEIAGRKFTRALSRSDSFHALGSALGPRRHH